MPRPVVHRELPPLSSIAAAVAPAPSGSKSRSLCDRLRPVILGVRSRKPRPFYAMRDVARAFGISVPSVARAYEILEREGLLQRVRSSQTVISSFAMQPRLFVRGVVALPIWTKGFCFMPPWRTFYISLEEELRKWNLVADFIFYQSGDEYQPSFISRVLSHHPDFLFWLDPEEAARPAIESASDAGVRIVVVSGKPPRFSGYRFSSRLEQGVGDALRRWKEWGVRTIVVPRSDHRDVLVCPDLEAHARKIGLRHRVVRPRGASHGRYLDALPRRSDEAYFFNADTWVRALCWSAPQQVAALLGGARCLGFASVNLPAEMLEGVKVDIVTFDNIAMARDVAAAIGGEQLGQAEPLPAFDTVFLSRVDARQFAQNFRADAAESNRDRPAQ